MIAPVMLLAIRESVRDMSAYVRKVRNFTIVPRVFLFFYIFILVCLAIHSNTQSF